LGRKWEQERSNKQVHIHQHQPTFTSGGTNNVNISGVTTETFVAGSVPKRNHAENEQTKRDPLQNEQE